MARVRYFLSEMLSRSALADFRTCAPSRMRSIRPLFRNNGQLGIPQCHGQFQEWIGDPLRGRYQIPLDLP